MWWVIKRVCCSKVLRACTWVNTAGRNDSAHQEKSIRLARSGTSGMSGMSGRFSCQKSLSSHFFSEFPYSHNYIKTLQNFYSFSQFINSFPPEYLHANSNFCSSSFKLRHTWHCWLMFNFLCLQRLSLTTTTYVHWTRKHCLYNKSA